MDKYTYTNELQHENTHIRRCNATVTDMGAIRLGIPAGQQVVIDLDKKPDGTYTARNIFTEVNGKLKYEGGYATTEVPGEQAIAPALVVTL